MSDTATPSEGCMVGGEHDPGLVTEADGHSHWRCLRCGQVTECGDLYERLAAVEHERWAHWQRYLHSQCERRADGSLVIPAGYVANLERLIETPYAGLSEAEKASDREQVDRYWHLLGRGSR